MPAMAGIVQAPRTGAAANRGEDASHNMYQPNVHWPANVRKGSNLLIQSDWVLNSALAIFRLEGKDPARPGRRTLRVAEIRRRGVGE